MEISRLATRVIPANPGLHRYKRNSNFVPRSSNLACGILTLYFCNPKNVLSECLSCLRVLPFRTSLPRNNSYLWWFERKYSPKVVALLEGMTLLEYI